jgi:hypothetical protein
MDLLQKELPPYDLRIRPLYTLRIGVEGDLLKAIDLARLWNMRLEMCRDFEPDEWRIETLVTVPGECRLQYYYFYSPGA